MGWCVVHHFLASSLVMRCLLPILLLARFLFMTLTPGRLSTM